MQTILDIMSDTTREATVYESQWVSAAVDALLTEAPVIRPQHLKTDVSKQQLPDNRGPTSTGKRMTSVRSVDRVAFDQTLGKELDKAIENEGQNLNKMDQRGKFLSTVIQNAQTLNVENMSDSYRTITNNFESWYNNREDMKSGSVVSWPLPNGEALRVFKGSWDEQGHGPMTRYFIIYDSNQGRQIRVADIDLGGAKGIVQALSDIYLTAVAAPYFKNAEIYGTGKDSYLVRKAKELATKSQGEEGKESESESPVPPNGDEKKPKKIDMPEILQAVKDQDYEQVGALIKNLANPNYMGVEGFAPLHIAVMRHDPKMVRILLDAGASRDKRSGSGHTPLIMAQNRLSTVQAENPNDELVEIYSIIIDMIDPSAAIARKSLSAKTSDEIMADRERMGNIPREIVRKHAAISDAANDSMARAAMVAVNKFGKAQKLFAKSATKDNGVIKIQLANDGDVEDAKSLISGIGLLAGNKFEISNEAGKTVDFKI